MTGRLERTLACAGLGAMLGFLLFAFRPVAHALPEYATRTGEPCATCHVNPAGGGPRTVRGTLWVAAGRPDKVPALPGGQQPTEAEATGQAGSNGAALYAQYGCGGCHGAAGEGGAGPSLNRRDLSAERIGQVIRSGQGSMVALGPGSMPDGDLAAVVKYVQGIGRGEVKVEAKSGPRKLGPARIRCDAGAAVAADPNLKSCGGN